VPSADPAPRSAKLLTHGMPTTEAETINADLPALLTA
jgi:hypothetical protein